MIFDVTIVGGGPAGYTAAIRGAEYGLKVALIEKSRQAGRDLPARGLHPDQGAAVQRRDLGPPEARGRVRHCRNRYAQLDWAAVLKRKNAIVAKHTKGLEFLMKKHKITVIAGYGRLTGPAKDGVHTIEVMRRRRGEVSQVKAKNVILATGSEAKMLPGLKADDAF